MCTCNTNNQCTVVDGAEAGIASNLDTIKTQLCVDAGKLEDINFPFSVALNVESQCPNDPAGDLTYEKLNNYLMSLLAEVCRLTGNVRDRLYEFDSDDFEVTATPSCPRIVKAKDTINPLPCHFNYDTGTKVLRIKGGADAGKSQSAQLNLLASGDYVSFEPLTTINIDIPDLDPSCQKCVASMAWELDPDTYKPQSGQSTGKTTFIQVEIWRDGVLYITDVQNRQYTNYGIEDSLTIWQNDEHFTVQLKEIIYSPHTYYLKVRSKIATGTGDNLISFDQYTSDWSYIIVNI